MKQENKLEAELEFNINVKEDDKIIAYCSGCHSVIFKGTDETAVQNRILRKTLHLHRRRYGRNHEIDVIYINRSLDDMVDAEEFLNTPAKLTARMGLIKGKVKYRPRLT